MDWLGQGFNSMARGDKMIYENKLVYAERNQGEMHQLEPLQPRQDI